MATPPSMAAPRRREDAPRTAFIGACTDPVHGHACGHELGLRPTLAEGSCSISRKGFHGLRLARAGCACVEICIDMCIHTCMHMCIGMCAAMCMDTRLQDRMQDKIVKIHVRRETVRLVKLKCHCLEGSRRRQLQHISYRNTFELSKTNTSPLGGLSSQTAPALTHRIHIGRGLMPVQIGHPGTTTCGTSTNWFGVRQVSTRREWLCKCGEEIDHSSRDKGCGP